jgi:hypothetical protein
MCDTGSPIVATVLNQPAHRYNFNNFDEVYPVDPKYGYVVTQEPFVDTAASRSAPVRRGTNSG